MSILTYIAGWPLLAALALIIVPRNYRVIIRAIAVLATLISAVLAVKMFCQYAGAPVDAEGYRFVQQISWVESLGISYHVGVDGLNVGLILMGTIVAFAAALCSWEIQTREKEFYILLLVMTGGILGAFASLDLFFFYFLHELALVPTFIMIGVWGRSEKKNYATFQITLYLSIGALIALIGLIALYLQSGANTFDIPKIIEHAKTNPLAVNAQNFIFPLLLFGFGILVSLFMGTARLRGRTVADRDAARRRVEKIRALRFDPHRAAVVAAGRAKLGARHCMALRWKHFVCRLGCDAPEGFEPAHR
jgi:NADH-quinone oxidoreductase subunit M